MSAEVKELTGEIRGVNVRWVEVIVQGHKVEHILSCDITEAEDVYGRPFDDDMDFFIQMGIAAVDRIANGETMNKVLTSTSYVPDGTSASALQRLNAVRILLRMGERSWSCVSGTTPISHKGLRHWENLSAEYQDLLLMEKECVD